MPGALASRYAQALADAIFKPGSGMEGSKAASEVRSFTDMVEGSPELRNVLLSPAVSIAKKRAVIKRFAEMLPLSPLVRNFLYVVVDRRRTDILPEIADAFDAALDERMGFVRGTVTSAAPLSEARKTEVEAALSRVSGKSVRCSFTVDSKLLGGVVARVGSTVYDGSVRTQLETLRQQLVS